MSFYTDIIHSHPIISETYNSNNKIEENSCFRDFLRKTSKINTYCKEKASELWVKVKSNLNRETILEGLSVSKRICKLYLSIGKITEKLSKTAQKVQNSSIRFFHNLRLINTARGVSLFVSVVLFPYQLLSMTKKCHTLCMQTFFPQNMGETKPVGGIEFLAEVGSFVRSVGSIASELAALHVVSVSVLRWATPLSIVGGFFSVFDCARAFRTQRRVGKTAKKINKIYKANETNVNKLQAISVLLRKMEEKKEGSVAESFGKKYTWIESRIERLDEKQSELAILALRDRVRTTVRSERLQMAVAITSIVATTLILTPTGIASPCVAASALSLSLAKTVYDLYQRHHFQTTLDALKTQNSVY